MNIKPGLAMGSSGEEVAALHDALTVIGLQIETGERDTQSFGASTVAAVIKLQVLAGVEQTGALDEDTIAVISFALDRLGVKPGGRGFTAAAAPYAVSGTVTDANGLPLAKAKVLAFDCDLRESKEIGRGNTDKNGAYRIAYKATRLLKGHTAADLRVEVLGEAEKPLLSSPITFNAPRQAKIDLALGGPGHAQPSELSSLVGKVTPLLGQITPAELQESGEHQDLSFIAGQTGLIRERLGYWVAAARLATSTELPVELFYGLFRSGVPADAHVTVLASSTQGVDLQENAQRLLEGVLSTSTGTISAAVSSAIAANLIPASYAAQAPSDVARLATLANQSALTSTQGFGKTSFASVLGAVSVEPEVQERFIALYTAAVGSARRTFWKDLKENSSFTETLVSDLRFGALTGRLTRGYVPLIEELAAQRSAGQIKGAPDLARLTAADWMALLEKQTSAGTPIGVPTFIEAQTPALARETYANMLARFFSRTYPTTAFSARLAADAQTTPFAAAAPTAAFLDTNAAFDLRYTNIDAFAAKTAIPPDVLPTLLTAQRLIKVNSDYTVMSALMADGIHSAQQVYAMGRDRFVAAYSSLPALGATEAARTWARAEQTYGMALSLAMKFNATLGAASPVSVGKVLPEEVKAQVAGFPNLQTLFGSESLCECEECESVLGDAAYLADILDFLAQREASVKASVRDVLFERRQDIAQIELNCANTDTALPYIDLVNELLEETVAPPQSPETPATAARKRQTTLSTPELNANPQYVNETAYEKLATAVYPWTLPFDLPLAEARAYLGQLNLSRAQLIETFQKPAGYPSAQAQALAIERLGCSAMQADIITAGPLASKFNAWEYWGLTERGNSIVDPDDPTKTISGFWIEVLSEVRVLLARAALDYRDLTHLLNTIFVNGEETVKIVAVPPGSCDVATMKLEGLTQDALERIHRFVRLWRCLGWSPYDLDNAIASLQSTTATGLGQLSEELLRQLACVADAMRRYSLSVPSAVALFAPTPSAVSIATRKIPTLPGDEEQYSLYHDLFENLTVLNPPDAAFALNAQGTEIAATGAKLADHGPALIAALQISEADLTLAIEKLTDGKLTLASLSALYRHIELARALGVTIAELIELLAIAEVPAETAPSYEPVEPFDAKRPESLATFAGVYATLVASGLSIEQVDYIVRGVQDTPDIAPEPVAVGTLLLGLYNGLVKIASEKASAQSPTGLIVQTLAQALGLETATAALLMNSWFPSLATAGHYVIADFLELPNKKLTDTTVPISPQDSEFAPYFTAYASLAKAALLITSLKLSAEDVKWWQASGVAAGWLDPTTLPTTPQAATEGRFYRLGRLIAGRNVRSAVPVPNASFATLFAPATMTKSEYLTQLATKTQWQPATLDALCGNPSSNADEGELSLSYPKDYEAELALTRILACETILSRTGIPAQLTSWIAPTLTGETADQIKQSVKANYPEQEWLTLAKQLRDPLRQSQRDALVSYLLASEPPAGVSNWLVPDDVFAHFLIDVEMCSCMATSRLVQATATVQLFVQRCFLGLEPKVTVDATTDSFWLQWQWMSQYRVWEANREVFLFPENWIDPSRRADASPFFTELQQDLKQGELGTEVAETALQNYLEKLEQVARLDVCGVFHDLEKGEDVLRVLARTQGSPPVYYMRKWLDSSLWTAWEKVELDINSDHVLPVVWNGKRYLFWAIVTVKADQHGQPRPAPRVSTTPPPMPNVHLEVQLAWSQFKQGKWQAKQTAPQTLVFSAPAGALSKSGKPFLGFEPTDITLKSAFNGQLLEIDVFLDEVHEEIEEIELYEAEPEGGGSSRIETQTYTEINNTPRTHVGAFLLGGAGNGVEAFVVREYLEKLENVGGGTPINQVGELHGSILKPAIAAPAESSFEGDWLTGEKMTFQSATRPRVGPMNTSYQLYHTLPSELVLKQADYYQLITPHQLPMFDSTLPFFYRDSAREYFIVPTNYYQNGNYFTINAPEYVYDPFFKAEYTFWPFYHPFVALLVGKLNLGGVKALYAQNIQLDPAAAAGVPEFDFNSYYEPTGFVLKPYPREGIDFEPNDGYSLYNWELFYHAPFLIANGLRTNQQFELAKEWYEYVFNPASGSTDPVPRRFWVTKPFYEMSAEKYAEEQITALMEAINHRNPTLEHQVALWRAEPFDPDAIAQMRPVAYQRAIVMQYIDNLIAWGDQLFTQDTMESINRATQLYVLAADLLGPRPEVVPPLLEPVVKTYSELEGSLDAFSNALVAAENAIPPVKVNVPTPEGSPSLPSLSTLYFQIPPNSQLLGYWGTVEDRLFKIRHCMNIEGVVQQLPLFSPPINPALLVAAAAAGLDLTSVLSELSAALPPYRFRTMIRHSLELCDQVRALGAELLAALEKRDAEALAQIRSSDEINVQTAIEEVRTTQIEAAKKEIEVLEKAKQAYLDREKFYVGRSLTNEWEALALILHASALIPQAVAIVADGTAAVAHAFPTIEAGVAGAGGTPAANVKIGGPNVGHAADKVGWIARMVAAIIQTGAELSASVGQYHQRQDDWNLQGEVAKDEIARIEAEKAVAEIRVEVATKEKEAQGLSVKEAKDVDAFLREKFTNKELYDWMVSQTSTTYFQAYQLAYSIAKATEQCFDRELAIAESDYIQFGYWDSLHQGLTAGEKLHYDLRRLESAYFTQNDRELEIVKHVSLLGLDPYALVQLRETGTCLIELPEILYDLDNPGHYMRRLKTVGLTVPCVVGPYTSVSATLTLLGSQVRTSPSAASSAEYPRKPGIDERFLDDPGGAEIVTSSAQSDSGLFELRFEDERYLPFESAGAVSNWRLTLNNVYPQFDYTTITDVVLHVRYTARDGGATLRKAAADAAKSSLNKMALAEESRKGLYRLFSARHEYPTEWAKFLNPATGGEQILTLEMPPERFPFFSNGLDLKVRSIDVLARTTDSNPYTLVLGAPGGHTETVTMSPESGLDGMQQKEVPLSPPIDLGRAPLSSETTPPTWTIKLKQQSAADFKSLLASQIEDVLLLVSYQVSE